MALPRAPEHRARRAERSGGSSRHPGGSSRRAESLLSLLIDSRIADLGSPMKTVIAVCAAAWVVASAPLAASAQSVPTVEELVRSPDYSGLAISRNGRYMATTIPSNGRMNLAVIEVETRTRTTLTSHSDFDVIDIAWVGNDRLLYKLGRFESPDGSGEYEGGGLFMISRDGKQQLRLSETRRDVRRAGARAYRDIDFVRTLPGGDDEVMVRANLREVDSFDLYRMNITNGQTTLLTESRPERTYRYLLDRNRVPRIAMSMPRDTNTVVLHFRRDEKTPWQELLRYDRTQPGMVEPLFFESNNRTLIVASNRGRDNVAVFRWDPSAPDKAMELVFEHASLDLGADATGGRRAAGDVFVDGTTEEVLGYTIQGERPQTVWNTEENRRPQRIVDRALPDTYNTIRRMRGNLHLVTARSDRWPATWHLWDESAGTIEDFLASRPWLMDRLVQMRPFTLTTRDGLQIPSYYLLPQSHKPEIDSPPWFMFTAARMCAPTCGALTAMVCVRRRCWPPAATPWCCRISAARRASATACTTAPLERSAGRCSMTTRTRHAGPCNRASPMPIASASRAPAMAVMRR